MFKFKKSLFLLSLLLFSQNIFACKKKVDSKPEILSDICLSIATTLSVKFYEIESDAQNHCSAAIYDNLMNEYGDFKNLSFVDNILKSENIHSIADDFAKVLFDIKYKDSSSYVGKFNCADEFRIFDEPPLTGNSLLSDIYKNNSFIFLRNKIEEIFLKYNKKSIYDRMKNFAKLTHKTTVFLSAGMTFWSLSEYISGSKIAAIMLPYYGKIFIALTVTPEIYKWVVSQFS